MLKELVLFKNFFLLMLDSSLLLVVSSFSLLLDVFVLVKLSSVVMLPCSYVVDLCIFGNNNDLSLVEAVHYFFNIHWNYQVNVLSQ